MEGLTLGLGRLGQKNDLKIGGCLGVEISDILIPKGIDQVKLGF